MIRGPVQEKCAECPCHLPREQLMTMPTYTAPGVYVEEVPSSQKVLTAAPTAVAAFVGFTATSPTDDPNDPQGLAPRLVTSWNQFEALYGGFSEGCILPLSVYGYFANGGSIAYICRVPNTEPAGQPARLALPAADRALGLPVAVESLEPDANITLLVSTDDDGGDGDGPTTSTSPPSSSWSSRAAMRWRRPSRCRCP